jgi:NitT/TauT family transport system ATP-binding protein
MIPDSPKLEVRRVVKSFRSRRGSLLALDGMSFCVAPGEIVCLVGPSGCGKSTLLNILAGLEPPDSGEILVDRSPIRGPGRDRALVFQEAALFPWLSVQDNVAFGLKAIGTPQAERQARVAQFLNLVGLAGFEKAYIHELSGGMKQRVALARALAINPDVLLMDEPFAALDAQSRDRMHDELQSIWAQTGKTIVFVTHNVREALVLGDRVLAMCARPGKVKREFCFSLARPRHIEDHTLVDAAREILGELQEELTKAMQQEVEHERPSH